MCKHHQTSSRSRRGRRRFSPERYARHVGAAVKQIHAENVARGKYQTYEQVKARAERRVARKYDYANGQGETPRVPAGSGGNKFVPTGGGSVGGGLVSSNTAPGRAMPAVVETDETLLKINGRLQRLRDSMERQRLRLKQGPATLEEIRAFEALQQHVAELERDVRQQQLMDAGSPDAEMRARSIVEYATRNGLTWQQAKERLFPLSG